MTKKKQQSLGDEFVMDAERYRKCSEPHESPEAAAEAIARFFDELSALRVKYRIRDLYVIYNVIIKESDGTETVGTSTVGLGMQNLFESMTACAYGLEKQKKEETIRKMLAGQTPEGR